MTNVQKKILIVEPESSIRDFLQDCLEQDQSNDYEYRESSQGRQALDEFVAWEPDCLIVGLVLSDMSGLEFLKTARERTGSIAFPMVFIGTGDQLCLRHEAIESGAQELVDLEKVSGDNLCWIVNFAIEKATMHQALEERQRELKKTNRKLKKNVAALTREVSDRQLADQALRLSNERYHSLAVASAEVVWTMDANGLVDDMPDWRTLTGQTRDEVRGWGWIEALHPDDRQRTVETWTACVQAQVECAMEYRVKTVDESYCVFAVRGVPVLEVDGTVREWVGTCKDVTNARRTLEMLRERDDQLRMALTAGRAGTWNWELYANELQWSDELSTVFGLDATPRDSTFDRFLESIHPDDRDMVQSSLATAIRQRQDVSLAYRIVWPDGTVRWVTTRGQLLVDDHGDPIRMIGISLDMTDRVAIEEALAESEERFRHMADTAPVFIWASGLDKQRAFVNLQWLLFTGRTMDEECADGWMDRVHPEDLDRYVTVYAEAFDQKRSFEIEFRLQRHDGEYRWILDHGVPRILPDGGFAGYIGSCSDITDRRHVEVEREELLARERDARAVAEMASHTKDEFLAVVSHELRAPLNAILGWARILQSKSVENETLVHAIDTIERSARAQSNIIDDLLDIARITSGKLRLEVRPIDLTSVMDAAVDVVRPAVEAKSIELIRIYDPEIDVITGDADRLQQVVWNLLANAVKFTPPDGQVIVRLERIDPFVQIQVCDTGKGISAEFLPRMFDRFNQADGSSTRRHGGLGLGLALARHLVEAHGGTISAESGGENAGSTFTVRLPLRAVRGQLQGQATVGSDEIPQAFPPVLEGLRILVVDDELDARELVTTLLTRYGATVKPTASSAEALAALTAAAPHERFDVMVSDIGLPDDDGYSLVRKVRELAPGLGGTVPAVALTAYGRSVDRVKALSAGFQMHVPKPVEPIELATVIASLTRRTVSDTVD